MTPPFRNPLLWLRRFRHRCGYGVHSPFAFSLITEVIYERGAFYEYKRLDQMLLWWQKFRVRRYLHLLFRLSNYSHPSKIYLFEATGLERSYLAAACPKARVLEGAEVSEGNAEEDGESNLIFLTSPSDEALRLVRPGTMLVLANVHAYKTWWDSLPKVLGFDLYDVGIAFFDPKYNKQDYEVNF